MPGSHAKLNSRQLTFKTEERNCTVILLEGLQLKMSWKTVKIRKFKYL
jgi:hypothetical protein